MDRWIKAVDGHYHNINSITNIYWKVNASAIGTRFELQSTAGMLAACNSESEKEIVIRALESFLESDNKLLIMPKF